MAVLFNNPWFCYGDACVLYAMLCDLRPARIVEVGSGFSSAVMLDTNDHNLQRGATCTFIDPHPERLLSLLSDADQQMHTVIARDVQQVDGAVFDALRANDILFIDSSHVGKIGSDVNHLLTHVLPCLSPGVVVHVHDVFWPFEYPEDWIRAGRAWNENYLLRAFLQFNDAFQIRFFNGYMAEQHAALMTEVMPLFMQNPGGSLWMQRV